MQKGLKKKKITIYETLSDPRNEWKKFHRNEDKKQYSK